MKYRKLRIALIATSAITCIVLACAVWYVSRYVVFASDRAWVLTATSFKLANSDVEITNPSLQKVLSEYNTKCKTDTGWSCSLSRRDGTIVIDQKAYPAYFDRDKFKGNIFVVEGSWKTIELYRSIDDPTLAEIESIPSKN